MADGSPGEAAFMAVVLFVMFLCLFIGWKTPETVVFMCLVLVWNVGLMSTTEALSGFSNTGMLAVGALFVVIKGVEKSQLADKAARRVFGLRTSMAAGIGRMMSLCFVLSAFLNNTPVVALLIPITRDWARARGFSPSIFLIPLSYSCIMGGLLTVIGTSTNLVVQGLIVEESKTNSSVEAVGFFEPGYIGVPLGIVGMIYLVIFAPRVLPARGGLFRFIRDRAKELLTEVQVMKDFPYIGEPSGLVLARLGLPQETLIKIRRRIPRSIFREMSASFEGKAGVGPLKKSQLGGVGSLEEGRGVKVDSASAIMEVNQKTFKAESMYSYRQRAEGLWGTVGDADREEKNEVIGRGLRKRWVSDTDALNLEDGALSSSKLGSGSPAVNKGHGNGVGGKSGGGFKATAEDATYTDIFPVSPAEAIQSGDVLFLSCAKATMIDFQAVTVSQGLKGLKFLDVSALDLPGHGSEFYECVLSNHNGFVGHSPGRDNSEFAKYYGCSVVAVRGRGAPDAMAPSGISAPPTASRGPVSSTFDNGAISVEDVNIPSGPAFDPGTGPVPLMSAKPEVFGKSAARVGIEISPTPSIKAMDTDAGMAAQGKNESMGGRKESNDITETVLNDSDMIRANHRDSKTHVRNVSLGGLNEADNVTETMFKAGDVVLVLAKEEFYEKYSASRDFFLLTKVGSVPKPVRYFDYLPIMAFLGMLIWVFLDADMVQAAFAAGAILVLGGWVDAKKAVGYVDWGLLLLIGSALGLSKGIVNSGLAGYVGSAIRDSGMSAEASLFVVYAFTMVCTELITNNAAAALSTPIAFSIANNLNVSYKPFVLTVMLAASSSFITPIGYQTNTLVWGPGGYKFTDFIKIGTPLSLIYLVLGCLLVPRVFPF